MVWFFLTIAGLLALLGALYWRWHRQIEAEIVEGAAIEWAHFQKNEPEFVQGMSEETFRDVYRRVHMPRFPGYALAAFATFLASLPISFGALAAGLWGAQKTGILPAPVEVADRLLVEDGQMRFFRDTPPEAALYYIEDLAGFYYFFGVLLIWLVIVAVFMRRYHARRPGYLRDEIIRARGS